MQRNLEQGLPAKIAWDEIYSFDLRLLSYSIDQESMRRAVDVKDLSGRGLRIAPAEEIIVYKLARFTRGDKGDIRGILMAQESLDWGRIENLSKQLSDETGRAEILDRLVVIKEWAKGRR